MQADYPAAAPSGRKLEKTRTPGIFRRGNRYIVVVRVDGRQVKRFAHTLAEARAIKSSIATPEASTGPRRSSPSRTTSGSGFRATRAARGAGCATAPSTATGR